MEKKLSLRKPGRETDKEVLDYINSFSPSLCLAKWYNATTWLGSGMTTSCHHPPAHHIPVESVLANYKAIHNTAEKKEDRRMMVNGERPAGCQYCWKIEDVGRDNISDRVYKTVIYSDEDIQAAAQTPVQDDVDLKTFEISFDRTCNFACSYCNPAFSSSWVTDIRRAGPYTGLVSDGRNHFTHTHDSAQLFKHDEENPYATAFFKWWEADLHRTLQELRLTGGEPLMSPHTWRLFDWFEQHDTEMRFAVNSNLGAKPELIDRLIRASHNIRHFHLYTSNESMHGHAEYIRDGLVWEDWAANVERILSEGRLEGFHMMCTINALCLESLPEFLTWCLDLKARYGKDYPTFTLNILRFPSFQSPLVLPEPLLSKFKWDLWEWLQQNRDSDLLHQIEINQVQRLIDYLDVVKTPHSETFERPALLNDFKKFYQQYDQRRNKSLSKTFPFIAEWYDSLND